MQLFETNYRTISKEDSGQSNVLVTGIGGFVGSHLANMLKFRNYSVVGIVRDMIPSSWLNTALNRCTIVQGDIRNRDFMKRIVDHYEINTVYHVAAFAQVKQAHRNPYEVFDSNVMGTVSVLEACKNSKRFSDNSGDIVVLNTDKCYGEKVDAVETDPYWPSEPYATSKVCQAMVCNTFRDTYGMNIKTAHSCNIFGYDPFNSRLIPNTIKSLIKNKSPIIYSNDNSIREYIYIDDVIEALYSLTSDNQDKPVYNISTGWIYNQTEIVEKILEYYNDINFSDIKPTHMTGNVPLQIQNESLRSENWSWQPSWSFEDALADTIDKFIIYQHDYM